IRVRRPGTETVDGDGADRVGPALDHAAARSLGRPDGEGAAGRCIGVPDDRDRAGGEELQVWPARERRGFRRWGGEGYGQRNNHEEAGPPPTERLARGSDRLRRRTRRVLGSGG